MKLKVKIDEKTFEVDVEAVEPESAVPQTRLYVTGNPTVRSAAPAAAAPAAPPSASTVADETKVCRSPVSGIVIKSVAKEGQSVQSGETIMVLEAMKMETNITAPGAIKIAKILVKEGDSVQSGQVLVEFE
ncbi:MAG: acetyl-CoA carboxylase biotin carboxyl carrier protein subunit [Acidobacteriota bacterium]|nr:acetyl-CoA carboxylase biotin carboxyl carrier protein subunit [Acidobacteriota bacterium]